MSADPTGAKGVSNGQYEANNNQGSSNGASSQDNLTSGAAYTSVINGADGSTASDTDGVNRYQGQVLEYKYIRMLE
jgi:hypothetical protein